MVSVAHQLGRRAIIVVKRRSLCANVSEIASAWNNESFDRVDAHLIGAAGVDCRIPTHERHPLLGFREASPLPMRMPDFD
jgi:hypothetical protein